VAAAAPAPADGGSLANVIGLVRAESIDSTVPDRLVGSLLSVSRAQEPLAESALK
jgi:hypothetical protein